MKRIAKTGFGICLALLLVGMACRIFWLASLTETGLQTLGQQWGDATIGWVLGKRVPIHSREPVEQAKYWLRKVDRALNDESQPAEITMGGALILDSPCPDFISKYVKQISRLAGAGLIPQLDDEAIRHATDAFELKCRQRCLELAAAATALEPTNAEWWRLRALLLWRYSLHSYDSEPRDPNWLKILNECSQHDPDNALYDYLAAYFYWESSAEQDFSGNDERLIIENRELFDRGIDCFQRGQSKPFFVVGDVGFSAVARFLADVPIPFCEQPSIVNSRSIQLRRSVLLRNVSRWQSLRAEEEILAGHIGGGLTLHRENLRLYEQFARADRSTAYDNGLLACRMATATQLSSLANKHKEILAAEEIQEIKAIEELAKIDEAVLQRAALALTAGATPKTVGLNVTGDPLSVAVAIAASMFLPVAILLLLLGFITITLTFVLKTRACTKIGWMGQVLAVVVAFAVTITVFGLAPARIINEEAQAWVLTILVVLTPILLLSWIVWVLLQRRAFRYSLRSLLISVSVVSVLLALVSITRPVADSLKMFPFNLAIPALGWDAWDASSLESVIRPLGSWLWAVFQWTAYYGHYLTVALWAVFIAILLHMKSLNEQFKLGGASRTARDRIGALFYSLGSPPTAGLGGTAMWWNAHPVQPPWLNTTARVY